MTSIYVNQGSMPDYVKAFSIYSKIKTIAPNDDIDLEGNVEALDFCIEFLKKGCPINMAVDYEEYYEQVIIGGVLYHTFKDGDGVGSQNSSFMSFYNLVNDYKSHSIWEKSFEDELIHLIYDLIKALDITINYSTSVYGGGGMELPEELEVLLS